MKVLFRDTRDSSEHKFVVEISATEIKRTGHSPQSLNDNGVEALLLKVLEDNMTAISIIKRGYATAKIAAEHAAQQAAWLAEAERVCPDVGK